MIKLPDGLLTLFLQPEVAEAGRQPFRQPLDSTRPEYQNRKLAAKLAPLCDIMKGFHR
jgi:hypothetical protein